VTLHPTSSPTSLSPVTATPSTDHPTGSPVTLSPETFAPSFSPVTFTPTTLAPSLGIPHIWRGGQTRRMQVLEGFPPFAGKLELDGNHTGRFFVQNLRPDTQELTISCRHLARSNSRQIEFFLERYGGDGPSKDNPERSIALKGSDPTRLVCQRVEEGTDIYCNGGFAGTFRGSIDSCDSDGFRKAGVAGFGEGDPEMACPHPCYEDQDLPVESRCGGGAQSTVAVYGVESEFNLFDDKLFSSYSPIMSRFVIECIIEREGTNQLTGFKVAGTVNEVLWPTVDEILFVNPKTNETESAMDDSGNLILTLNRASQLTLVTRSDVGVLGASDYTTNQELCPLVMIGGIQANVTSCSWTNVSLITPTFFEVCEGKSDNEECGYQPVTVSTRETMFNDGRKGASIVCPGGPCTFGGSGIFYTGTCASEFNDFLDVDKCDDLREEDQSRCAFGLGDDCRRCEPNAFCPGGYRMWPWPGHWTSGEDSGVIIRCPPPALARCLGWNAGRSQYDCGEGFDGYVCNQCADGYYEQLGECLKCPDDREGAVRLVVLLVGAAVLFCVLYACVRLAIGYESDAKTKELISWQAKDFVIWALLQVQAFSLVVSSVGANAREATSLFAWISVAAFDFQAVGPECFDNGARLFLREYILLSIAVLACIVLAVLQNNRTEGRVPYRNFIRNKGFALMTALYAPCTFLSLSVTYCIRSKDGNGNDVALAWVNPNLKCFQGDHLPVAALGATSCLCLTIFYPIWLFNKLRGILNKATDFRTLAGKLRAQQYRRFFGDDFYPDYFWVLHSNFILILTICATRVYLSAENKELQIAKLSLDLFVISLHGSLIIFLRPYVRHMSWKAPVQICLLVLLALAAVLDYFNFLVTSGETDVVISTETVEALSYLVFGVGLFNFLVLAIAFYYVVLHPKSRHYYQDHFLLQRQGHLLTKGSVITRKHKSMQSAIGEQKMELGRYNSYKDIGRSPSQVRSHMRSSIPTPLESPRRKQTRNTSLLPSYWRKSRAGEEVGSKGKGKNKLSTLGSEVADGANSRDASILNLPKNRRTHSSFTVFFHARGNSFHDKPPRKSLGVQGLNRPHSPPVTSPVGSPAGGISSSNSGLTESNMVVITDNDEVTNLPENFIMVLPSEERTHEQKESKKSDEIQRSYSSRVTHTRTRGMSRYMEDSDEEDEEEGSRKQTPTRRVRKLSGVRATQASRVRRNSIYDDDKKANA